MVSGAAALFSAGKSRGSILVRFVTLAMLANKVRTRKITSSGMEMSSM